MNLAYDWLKRKLFLFSLNHICDSFKPHLITLSSKKYLPVLYESSIFSEQLSEIFPAFRFAVLVDGWPFKEHFGTDIIPHLFCGETATDVRFRSFLDILDFICCAWHLNVRTLFLFCSLDIGHLNVNVLWKIMDSKYLKANKLLWGASNLAWIIVFYTGNKLNHEIVWMENEWNFSLICKLNKTFQFYDT